MMRRNEIKKDLKTRPFVFGLQLQLVFTQVDTKMESSDVVRSDKHTESSLRGSLSLQDG